TVYRARQTSLNRTVALKILSRRLVRSEHYVKRFQREARMAARIDHPHAIHVYDAGNHGRYWYLVMEYVGGESLDAVIKREGCLDETRALELIEQIAGALGQAHARGIIHRDVKPSNIIVDKNGNARLADLGLAKQMRAVDEILTRTGFTVGTPAYMSPEQCRGEDDDERSDIYALGATLYHLLSGRPPFTGDNDLQVMRKQAEEPLVPVHRHDPSISVAASAVVDKMMAKDKNDRYVSAEALLADLSALRGQQQPRALAEKRERKRRAARAAVVDERRPGVSPVIIVVALLLIAAGLGLFLALRGPRETLMQRATRFEREAQLEQALAAYQEAAEKAGDTPEGRKARRAIGRVRGEINWMSLLERAQALRASGDLRQATGLCRELARKAGDTVAAMALALEKQIIVQGFTEAMATHREASTRRDWAAAASAADDAIFFRPLDERALEARDTARFRRLCVTARTAEAKGKLTQAINDYEQALLLHSDQEIAQRLEALRARARRTETFTELVAELQRTSPGQWQWTEARLARLAPFERHVREAIESPRKFDIAAPHVRPQLLLALHRRHHADAAITAATLFRAGGGEGYEAGRALASMGADGAMRLAGMLDSKEEDVRRRAGELLASVGATAAPVLKQLAGDDNAATRDRAFAALATLGEAAIPALTDLIAHDDVAVRRRACDDLAQIGLIAAPPLIARLPKYEGEARVSAVACLQQIGPGVLPHLIDAMLRGDNAAVDTAKKLAKEFKAKSVPPLLHVLHNSPPKQQDRALTLILSLGNEAVPALLDAFRPRSQRRAEAERVLKAMGDDAASPLITGLGDRDPAVRQAAETALVLIGKPVIQKLVHAITQGAPAQARDRGIAILQALGDEGVPALLWLSVGKSRTVKDDAAKAIIELGDKSIRTLERALEDRSSEIRAQSARFIVALNNRDSLPRLWPMARDDSARVRAVVAAALGTMADTRSIEALERMMRDRSSQVRAETVESLAKIGGAEAADAVAPGLRDRSSGVRDKTTVALVGMGEAALGALRKALKSKDEDFRVRAAKVAGGIDAPDAVDVLLSALDDTAPKVRKTAVEELGRQGRARATPSLLRMLNDATTDVRVAAVEALATIGDRTALDDLIDVLKENRTEVRIAACAAIAKFGGLVAKDALTRASLEDPSILVRQAAA
ncbi:MAG: protein kinase, partial [Bradyrhizobium sp.]|nr:protein kinase [Bradyrhizobium sp.]